MPLNAEFSERKNCTATRSENKIPPSFEQLPLLPLCKDQRELFHKNPFLRQFENVSEETKPDFPG